MENVDTHVKETASIENMRSAISYVPFYLLVSFYSIVIEKFDTVGSPVKCVSCQKSFL